MDIDLSRFRDTFFQETAEHLETLETTLLSLQSGKADSDALNAIFRCAHSVKAGAGTFGFDAMARFTHVLETLFDCLRNGELTLTEPLLELVLQSVDVLREQLDAATRGDPAPQNWENLAAQLDGACHRDEGVAAPAGVLSPVANAGKGYDIGFEPNAEIFTLGLDPLLVLRDLAELGNMTAEADLSRLPGILSLDADRCYLSWRLRLETTAGIEEVRDVFAFVEDVAKVEIVPWAEPSKAQAEVVAQPRPGAPPVHRESSIRVATGKVDSLIDLVGELVIANSMAAQLMDGFTPDGLPRLKSAMADIDRYTRELQDRAMRIRMMPLGTIFNRFPRLVHDAAHAIGKQVALEISGEDTELDKGMVERVADPLTHLIRNAVDHGIETPDERQRAGKPAEASVRLSAYYQAGNAIIEVSDDGRGLNTERIRAKAIERQLISIDEPLSDEQIHALIFRPGFSTAEIVSDLSGRGVGMDVVKRSIEGMNGTVSIETAPGRGTTFRMKLPLTLAIVDGLLLGVGDQTYVMPLISIVESIRPQACAVRGVAGKGDVVMVRKEPLPLIRLSRLFHIPARVENPTQGLVVIVEHEGRRVALLVDDLLGQQQVVVKSLETNFRKVEGVAGATILGDGRAALILDVAGITAMSKAA